MLGGKGEQTQMKNNPLSFTERLSKLKEILKNNNKSNDLALIAKPSHNNPSLPSFFEHIERIKQVLKVNQTKDKTLKTHSEIYLSNLNNFKPLMHGNNYYSQQ
jgi:hypothetical protein